MSKFTLTVAVLREIGEPEDRAFCAAKVTDSDGKDIWGARGAPVDAVGSLEASLREALSELAPYILERVSKI